MNAASRLLALREKSAQVARSASLPAIDDVRGLSVQRREAWHRLISGLVGSEHLEDALLAPVIARLPEGDVRFWLMQHSADEQRHAEELAHYVTGTFGFVQTKRSWMTMLLYEQVMPRVGEHIVHAPLPLWAVVYAYETISVWIYNELRKSAKRDGLVGLSAMLGAIARDEGRHISAMKHLIEAEMPTTRAQVATTAAALGMVALDLRMPRWALQNRRARARMTELGIDPEALTRMTDRTLAETLRLVRSSA
jgi:hypothetical protein